MNTDQYLWWIVHQSTCGRKEDTKR